MSTIDSICSTYSSTNDDSYSHQEDQDSEQEDFMFSKIQRKNNIKAEEGSLTEQSVSFRSEVEPERRRNWPYIRPKNRISEMETHFYPGSNKYMNRTMYNYDEIVSEVDLPCVVDLVELQCLNMSADVPFSSYKSNKTIESCCNHLNYGYNCNFYDEPVMYDNIFQHQDSLFGNYLSCYIPNTITNGKELGLYSPDTKAITSLFTFPSDLSSEITWLITFAEREALCVAESLIWSEKKCNPNEIFSILQKEENAINGKKSEISLVIDEFHRHSISDCYRVLKCSGKPGGISSFVMKMAAIITVIKYFSADNEFQYKGKWTSNYLELNKLMTNFAYSVLWSGQTTRTEAMRSMYIGEYIAITVIRGWTKTQHTHESKHFQIHNRKVITL